MRIRLAKITIAVLVACLAESLSIQWSRGENLNKELTEVSRIKQWAVSDRYAPSRGINVKIGDGDHVIYQSQESNAGFGHTAIASRGQKLAFVKTVRNGSESKVRLKLGIIDIDGSNYTELLDIAALTAGDIAWSHDEQKLAFMGALQKGSYSLVILDIGSRPVHVLVKRPLPAGKSLINMTSQAWAPDNERLVYVNAKGSMVILNVGKNTEVDLGSGNDPTWSRDGMYIAYRADEYGKPPGDYFLRATAPTRQREHLLSNTESVAGKETSKWYLGPPLWSPDGRFILIKRIVGPGESQQPYVLKVMTREIEPLPIGTMVDMRSWGGKP